MVWNQPSENEPELDPWSKKNKNSKRSKKSKNGLCTLIDFKKIFNFFKIRMKLFYGGSGFFRNVQNSSILVFIITLFVLIINGFYTIKEAERGVITNFGKFSHLVEPGLNWRPVFISQVTPVNVKSVKELATSGIMLTSDENVVRVEMNVQYRITNPLQYLFSVSNPDDSLREATDSALRGVIGHSTMDRVLTEGRTVVRSETQKEIEETIRPYNMGITILDVNFQTARPPEEVKSAFDDAIAARENREQYIREAEAYANEVEPKAYGQAQRVLNKARSYKFQIISEAKGEAIRFLKMLSIYKTSKNITANRLYIESMEKIFRNSRKILVNNNFLLFNLGSLFSKDNKISKNSDSFPRKQKIFVDNDFTSEKINDSNAISNILKKEIMDKRKSNSFRTDCPRKGRE